MNIDCTSCKFNYGTAEESYKVDSVLVVFSKCESHFYLVKWTNYLGEDSWELDHILLHDGYKLTIYELRLRTGGNPAQNFHPDPDRKRRCWVCDWMNKNNDAR